MVYTRGKGKTYWYEFVYKGVRFRNSTKQKNKRAAIDIEAAKITQLSKGEVGIQEPKPEPPVPTFAAYAGDVIRTLKARNKNTATVAFYEAKLKRLLEFRKIAEARLNEITPQTIDDYIEFSRRTKTRATITDRKKATRRYQVAPATVNRELATLRMILYRAKKEHLIASVPEFELLPGERQRDFVLTASQERLYLEACPNPLDDIALLLLDTGLRIGEALNLTWADVQLTPSAGFKFGYLEVRHGKSRNAERTIPLTPRATSMLSRLKLAAAHSLVFVNESGSGPWLGTSLDHQHQKVRNALKMHVDFVIHSLRHTFLTRLGLSGADAFTIKKLAGHYSVTVSERYVHPSSESNERALERMMAEYRHIGDRHGSLEPEKGKKAEVENRTHNFPHTEATAISKRSRKLLN